MSVLWKSTLWGFSHFLEASPWMPNKHFKKAFWIANNQEKIFCIFFFWRGRNNIVKWKMMIHSKNGARSRKRITKNRRNSRKNIFSCVYKQKKIINCWKFISRSSNDLWIFEVFFGFFFSGGLVLRLAPWDVLILTERFPCGAGSWKAVREPSTLIRTHKDWKK